MTKRALVWLLTAIALVAAANVAAAAALSASNDRPQARRQEQHSRPKWWQDERFKAELALTAQQAQEVEQIFQSALPKLRSGKQQLDQLEADLSKMIRERTADDATVAQAIERVERMRGELNTHRQLMLYRMHRVLSADQNAKLQAIFDRERKGERRDRKENHQ
jgi:Spy/CpxP family protein refolding chaperone